MKLRTKKALAIGASIILTLGEVMGITGLVMNNGKLSVESQEGDTDASTKGEKSVRTLVRLDIAPDKIVFNQDGSTPVRVYAIYSNGEKIDVTSASTYTSENSSVAYVSNGFVYNGVNGDTEISGIYNGLMSEEMDVVVNANTLDENATIKSYIYPKEASSEEESIVITTEDVINVE